jgi:hypothetical protein
MLANAKRGLSIIEVFYLRHYSCPYEKKHGVPFDIFCEKKILYEKL